MLDNIYNADARIISMLDLEPVHLVITSPPYNAGVAYKGYHDFQEASEYRYMLFQVFKGCVEVLVGGGRLAINVANTGRKPYMPLHRLIMEIADELALTMRGEIIWNKGASAGVSTAWGSFASPSNPVLRDVHEYVLVYSKGNMQMPKNGMGPDITHDEFTAWTKSVWEIPAQSTLTHPVTHQKLDHPAPFPIELATRLMKLYSFPGQTVLDPFMGSGTTAVAALRTGRHFIGCEVVEEYCKIAEERIQYERSKLF